MSETTINTKFNRKWILWYHHIKDNWKKEGFRNLYTIESINDFWKLYKQWDKLGGVNNQHFFLMMEGVYPMWEDEANKTGGCWSYKKCEGDALDLWTDLSVYLVGETLSSKYEEINGISVCLKKGNNSVIKIWNSNNKHNSLSILNSKILEKWGTDIIYIAHIPDN